MHLLQALSRDALLEQLSEDTLHLTGAANHPNIASVRLYSRTQCILIEMMTSRDNDDIARGVGFECTNSLRNITKGQLHLVSEHLRIRQIATIIDNDDAKIEIGCQPCQC